MDTSSYLCGICAKDFPTRRSIRKHIRLEHSITRSNGKMRERQKSMFEEAKVVKV